MLGPTTPAPARPPTGPSRPELAALLAGLASRDGAHDTAVPGLRAYRSSAPAGPVPGVYEPALCVIAQGRKRMLVGDAVVAYDPAHYLLVAADLPLTGEVVGASAAEPYLGLRLAIDPAAVADVVLAMGPGGPTGGADVGRGVVVGELDALLADAVGRLVRLAARPADVAVLAPLVTREILYLLLTGPHGRRLRAVTVGGPGAAAGVAGALRRLRRDFARPVPSADLARAAHLSPSAFRRQFKAVAAMTPLQYQKRLRLQEARRLLLAGAADVATVAHRVGYESATQFSREYRRLFGDPPRRDVTRVRDAAGLGRP